MSEMALTDYRSKGKKAEGGFRLAWSFKSDAAERIKEILEAESVWEPVVHGFCGASAPIAKPEIRVDLHHPSADLKVDFADLDKHVQGAPVVFMDPPYGGNVATKQRLLAAGLRALRPGGLLIVHAPWWPRFRGAHLELGPVYGPFFREDNSIGWPHPPVILSCWRKKASEIEAGVQK